jgi:transcription initiation factor IIF auxiliary subunit
MEIRQSESYVGDNWWNWSVWIEGSNEELDRVEYVEWRLDPTFSNPVRRVEDRGTNFRLETGGWGVFMIHAFARRKDGTTEQMRHYLELHYPDGRLNLA